VTFAELWNGLNQNTDTSAGVVLSQSRLYHLLKDTWITAHKQGHHVGHTEGQKRGLELAEHRARTDAEKLFVEAFITSSRDN